MQDYDTIARAEGDINIAILRLLEKYPFHAHILEQVKIRPRPEVGTMGVSVSGSDLVLYHNPDYVLSLPPEQLRGVLLHEIHHVILGHVTADPAEFPDEWARMVAEEVTVNEFVREPLPKGAVILKMFPGLPRMESTQRRYDRLKNRRRRPPIHSPGKSGSPSQEPSDTSNKPAPRPGKGAGDDEQPGGQGEGGNNEQGKMEGASGMECTSGSPSQMPTDTSNKLAPGPGTCAGQLGGQGEGDNNEQGQMECASGSAAQKPSNTSSKTAPRPRTCSEGDQQPGGQGKDDNNRQGQRAADSGTETTKGTKGGDKSKNSGKSADTTVDDHSVWAEAQQDLQRSKDVIRDAILQAAYEVGRDQVPDGLWECLGIGSMPGESEREMRDPQKGHLDWRRRLRRYVGGAVEVRPVFNRPPRRFPTMAGILPGRRRHPAKPKIMAVIDTSGSITADLLQMIDAELARLAKTYEVKVVECDAMIHAVYDYRRIKKVKGGGGTDLCPPFEKAFLRQHRPDLLIYFSDGYGAAPDKPPKVKVIWCLTPDGIRPAPWGKLIQMEKAVSRD